MKLETLLTLVLGGGGAATLGAIVAGVRSIREGFRTRERDTIGALVSRAETAETDAAEHKEEASVHKAEAERQAELRLFWRNRAADLEYIMRTKGLTSEIPALPPLPNSE